MGSSLNPHNWTPDWQLNIVTYIFVHLPTGVEVTEEMAVDYGFPDPQYCRSAIAIRQWYFAKIRNARIAGQAPSGPMPNFSWSPKTPVQPQVFYQQMQVPQNQQYMNRYLTSKSAWYLCPEPPHQPIELLLCVESFIVRIP